MTLNIPLQQPFDGDVMCATVTPTSTRPSYLLAIRGSAVMLGVAVFFADTFIHSTVPIAVLYAAVLALFNEAASNRRIILSGLVCASLAIISKCYSYGSMGAIAELTSLGVSLSALTSVLWLLVRNAGAREALVECSSDLLRSEGRYKAIFSDSRTALWEYDYSVLKQRLHELEVDGLSDLRAYLRSDPSILREYRNCARRTAANREALAVSGERSHSEPFHQQAREDEETFVEILNAIFSGLTRFECNGTLLTAVGEAKPAVFRICFPETPKGFKRVVMDIAEIAECGSFKSSLLETRTELFQASRAATVGVLSASLSHELSQPLGAIILNAQILLRWLAHTPPQLDAVKRAAERLVQNGERASLIVKNTRMMLLNKAPLLQPVELSRLIKDTQILLEHDLLQDDIEIVIQDRTSGCWVKAVHIELQQVLINLITNARQAMSHSPLKRLIITLDHQDDRFVNVSVRDFGPGIREEPMEKIFDAFHTTKPTGMGLGLSLCRSIMEARGGQLTAANHPECGAVFEILIPIEGIPNENANKANYEEVRDS
ncbi:ATP-binding protein [Rhizobium tubonense]|uniref:histidine kinase n=1 Tax=Rhizobium tubonense TaxID=484088 RepID=A0A2W4DVI5_9HYPH|nr:ATP-binding protein [Rhizobium tubonense]PZM08026.1 two-component sensor histidine kinase [Rhizobium tubonense]